MSGKSLLYQSTQKEKLLSKISKVLGESIDYKTTIQNIGKVLIPTFADYVRIALVNEKKEISDITAFHKDAKQAGLVKKLYDQYKNQSTTTMGIGHILRTGQSEIMQEVKGELVEKSTQGIKKTINKLRLVSYMGVPLKVHRKIIGAITFSSTTKGKNYTTNDLQLAEEISLRISYAVENARLFNSVQQALEEKEASQLQKARLAAIISSSGDAIISKNLDSIIQTWNHTAEKMFGYTAQEAIGKPIYIIIPPDRYHEEKKIIATLKKGERIKHFQTIRKTKSGKLIDVSLTISPIFNDEGEIIGASKIARDISSEVRMQNNLTFSLEASKLLFSSLDYKQTLQNVAKLAVPHVADWCAIDMQTDTGIEQIAIAHVDPQRVQWANELRRNHPPDPQGKTGIPKVLQTGKIEFIPHITEEMLTKAVTNTSQLALIQKLQLVAVMIIPIKFGKKILGAISFLSAESGHHYTKGDLQIAKDLASRAAIAIENANLYSIAQNSIKIRDEFISLASHELKTPLTSLKLFTQILEKRFLKKHDPTTLTLMHTMEKQINKLSLLINDLLNVSKIQHGKLEFSMEFIDLGSLVKEIVDLLQQTTQTHTILLTGTVHHRVYADQYRLYQVLTNLITNAIKYSPKGKKIFVHISSTKDTVSVSVKDFGIGIDAKDQKNIFNQFYRATNSQGTPGLGMGLYISQEIIKRHNGILQVTSEKNKGSRFTFTLPRVFENK